MKLKHLSRMLVIAGTLLIWFVKFVLRPFVHIPHTLKPLVGVAPNLVGSFLIPFTACWLFGRYFRLRTQNDLLITCVTGLVLVIGNEYLQRIPVFGRTFDYLDIAASVIGVLSGYLVFARLQETQTQTVFTTASA